MATVTADPPVSTPGRNTLAVALVFAVVAAVCFFRLGSVPLYETDEGFAGVRADSFYRHHSWILSYDDVNDDSPQFRKPPMLYWCVAVLLKTVGHNTWAVRLPTAGAAFLAIFILYRLARRYLDEWTALTACLYMTAVPFMVFHIRTAMLELPVILALLGGMYAFAFMSETWRRPVLVGLCGGAAILTKGGGGAQAIVIPIAFGLLHHRFRLRAWMEGLAALAVAALLPLLYYLAVPPEYRERVIRDLFVGEGAKRLRATDSAWHRLGIGFEALKSMLRWHVPAALCGAALAVLRLPRQRAPAAWIAVTFLFSIPLLWVYAAMVPPFPRYLLPVFPLLLSFSAFFAMQAASSRWTAAMLVPFIWFAARMDRHDKWFWAPVAAAAVVLLLTWIGWAREKPRRRLELGILLAVAIAAASYASPRAWAFFPPPQHLPRPELLPLMDKAQTLIPPDQKLVVENGLKCHSMLFYARRSVDTFEQWLLSAAEPGQTRYGVFLNEPPAWIPGVNIRIVERSDPWKLAEITAGAGDKPWRGVLICKPAESAEVGQALEMLGVTADPFPRGFVLQAVPDGGIPLALPPGAHVELVQVESVAEESRERGHSRPTEGTSGPATLMQREFVLRAGDAVEYRFPRAIECCGVDIVPADRRQSLPCFTIEARGPDGAWHALRRVETPFKPNYTVERGHVRGVPFPAVRVRFEPVSAGALRIMRTGGPAIRVAKVTLWTPDGKDQ